MPLVHFRLTVSTSDTHAHHDWNSSALSAEGFEDLGYDKTQEVGSSTVKHQETAGISVIVTVSPVLVSQAESAVSFLRGLFYVHHGLSV